MSLSNFESMSIFSPSMTTPYRDNFANQSSGVASPPTERKKLEVRLKRGISRVYMYEGCLRIRIRICTESTPYMNHRMEELYATVVSIILLFWLAKGSHASITMSFGILAHFWDLENFIGCNETAEKSTGNPQALFKE